MKERSSPRASRTSLCAHVLREGEWSAKLGGADRVPEKVQLHPAHGVASPVGPSQDGLEEERPDPVLLNLNLERLVAQMQEGGQPEGAEPGPRRRTSKSGPLQPATRKVDKADQEGDARLRDEGPENVLLKRASYEAISRARSCKRSTGPRGGASRSNPSLKGCSAQRIETQHKIAASASASATIATNWNRQHAAKRTTLWNSLMLP